MKNYPLYPSKSFVNMRELLEHIHNKYGNDIAISYRKNPHDSEIQTRTYARLCEDVRCIATALFERGISNGVHCALIGRLTYGWICTYFAVMSVGAVLVPLDPDWGAGDLADTVKKAECEHLFCSDDVLTNKAGAICLAANIATTVAIDNAEHELTIDMLRDEGAELREDGSRGYEAARINPDKLALLVYTSGTTGKGKGVMLSQTAVLSNAYGALRILRTDERGRTVGVLPPHHTFGSTISIVCSLLFGTNIYLSSGIRYIVKELREHKPTYLILVPLYLETFYRKIKASIAESGKEKTLSGLMKVTNAISRTGIDFRQKMYKGMLSAFGGELKIAVSGGAPLVKEIADAFESFGIRVINGYGITECAPMLAANRDKQVKCGSVGMPIPNVIIKIKDPDENGEGEICAKGPNVMLGYYKDEQATADAFDEDGYFRTGDVGKLDDDGWLYITGRAKNLIILSNGKNVYPEEIETELSAVPGVVDVVVYEGISKRGGEHNAIVAEIYPDKEYFEKNNIENKQEYFKKYINDFNKKAVAYKKIGVLKIRETEFPKNTLRKITRFKIDKTID